MLIKGVEIKGDQTRIISTLLNCLISLPFRFTFARVKLIVFSYIIIRRGDNEGCTIKNRKCAGLI